MLSIDIIIITNIYSHIMFILYMYTYYNIYLYIIVIYYNTYIYLIIYTI